MSENSFPEEGELTRLLAEELQEVTESTRGLSNKWSQGSGCSHLWRRVKGPQAGRLKVGDLVASPTRCPSTGSKSVTLAFFSKSLEAQVGCALQAFAHALVLMKVMVMVR